MSRLLPAVLIERDRSGQTFIVLERRDVPLVYATLSSPGGFGLMASPGLVQMTIKLLNEGSAKIEGQAWRTKLARHALGLPLWASETFWSMSLDALREDFETGLCLMAELAASPRLPESEWRRLINEFDAEAKDDWAAPVQIVGYLSQIQNLGYGHPCAAPGVAERIRKLAFSDAQSLGRNAFSYGAGSAIMAGGDLDAEVTLDALKRRFSALPQPTPLKSPPPVRPSRIPTWVISKPLSQAFFVLSRPGIRKGDSQRVALRLANCALGGGFSSRLFMAVREHFGGTYHIHSELPERLYDSPFSITSFCDVTKFGAMLALIQKTLQSVMEDGFTQEEVNTAREYCFGSLPLRLASPSDVLWHVFGGWECGLTPQQLEEDWLAIRDITRESVDAAARTMLGNLAFRLTVLGPYDTLRYQLEDRGKIACIPTQDADKPQHWPT